MAESGAGDNPYQFTGREDDGTGLYYRARYYSPVLQRFLSEDPIGFDGGTNLYAYTANQPTVFTDPFGEKPSNTGKVADQTLGLGRAIRATRSVGAVTSQSRVRDTRR